MRLANELAAKEDARRADRVRSILMLLLVIGLACGGVLLYPAVHAYLAPPPPPPVEAVAPSVPPPVVVAKPVEDAPIEAPQLPQAAEAAPEANVVPEQRPQPDPAVIARLRDRLAHGDEGVRLLTKDQRATADAIRASDMRIYGTYTSSPSTRDANGLVHYLTAAERLRDDMVRTSPNAVNMIDKQNVIVANYIAQITNEKTIMAHNQDVLRSITDRLAKATAERDLMACQLEEANH